MSWEQARTIVALRARAFAPWLGLAVLFSLLALACVFDIVSRGGVGADFRSFYMAGRAAAAGADPYDTAVLNKLATGLGLPPGVYPYLYPPFFAFEIGSLAALSPARAHEVWALIALGVLGAGLAIHARTLHRALGNGVAEIATLAGLLLTLLPLRDNVGMGQVNVAVLGVLLAAVGALASGLDVLAGAALALAAMVKVTPAVFVLFFLARRRYRAALAFFVTLGVLFLVSVRHGALPAWIRWFSLLPSLGHGATVRGLFPPGVTFNFGLAGAFARVFPERVTLVRALSIGTAAALLVPVLVRARRAADEAEAQRALPPLFVVMVMSSPLVYLHHMIYLLPAVLFLVASGLRERRYARIAGALLPAALVSVDVTALYAWYRLPDVATHLLTSITLYALLVLYGVAVAAMWPPRPASAPSA